LEEYRIGGIRTNLGLFRRILNDPDFVAARIDTGFLDRMLSAQRAPAGSALRGPANVEEIAAISAALFAATATDPGSHVHASNGVAKPDQVSRQSDTWTRAARREALRDA